MAISNRMYVLLGENGRIDAITPYKEYAQGMEEFVLPEYFDIYNWHEYRIVDGEAIHDPLPPEKPDIEELKKEQRLMQLQDVASLFVRTSSLTDEQALKVSAFYDEWNNASHYEKDDICIYGFKLYRCRSAHDAQESWNPADAHSLWGEIVPPGEIQEWRPSQPGIFDGYEKGQKVLYKGDIWVSVFERLNVWEPGVYGWEKDVNENG